MSSPRIKDLQAKIAAEVARAEAISAIAHEEDRELSDEETAEIDAIIAKDAGSVAKLEKQLEREQRIVDLAIKKMAEGGEFDTNGEAKSFKVPASAKRHGQLRAFKGEDAEKDAYLSGQFLLATLGGNESARTWCMDHGVQIRAAHSTDVNTKGGFLVPDPLEAAIIRQVENYGVFRQNVGMVWPMPGGALKVPKRNGGFTSYYVGENSAITASDMAFSQVSLAANKLAVLTQVSSELLEDSVIALADLIANEFAYKFAYEEDNAGFNGDGTSTYGGIVGLKSALLDSAVVTTATNIDTPAELTIATIHDAMGKLAQYPGVMPKWYMHSSIWSNAFERLAVAAGGNDTQTYAAGMGRSFLGYPVVFAQVLPNGASTDDLSGEIFAYFGDISMTCAMGQARGVTLSSDSSVYFTSDALALKATERYDIVCHDVGTSTSTDQAGAMVALKFNAS